VLQPALLGGVVIGVLSALPVINIANCCCAWILFGGALSAYLMQQNRPTPISAGDGALVGLMAGAIGAFVWLAVSIPLNAALSPFQTRILERALDNARDMPAEAREWMESLRGGSAVGLGTVIGFIIMLFIGSVFGMLGGLFGALMFRKAAPPPPPPPPISGFTPPAFTPPGNDPL
jgi:pheromone shutdown protein TraB